MNDQSATSILRLNVSRLAVTRGGRSVLADVTFSVHPGEALVVSGPNGVGKSTLLRTIAGLITPASGELMLEGTPEPAMPGLSAHYIGHSDALKGSLTARENLDFWTAMLGRSATSLSSGEALARLGLSHVLDFPAAYLSAGQKRRVTLARLLVADRPLWLLDEPTTALDRASQSRLSDAMRAHLDGGGMILAATHGPLGLSPTRELVLGGPK